MGKDTLRLMKKTITICGSMHFAERMSQLSQELQSLGYEVYIPDGDEPSDGYSSLDEAGQIRLKNHYINAHLDYIKRSDGILVANFEKNGVAGYIGANTLMEIAFAYVLGKRIFALNLIGEQSCKLEVLGMQPVVLNGQWNSLRL